MRREFLNMLQEVFVITRQFPVFFRFQLSYLNRSSFMYVCMYVCLFGSACIKHTKQDVHMNKEQRTVLIKVLS